jgi:hypothetical protein
MQMKAHVQDEATSTKTSRGNTRRIAIGKTLFRDLVAILVVTLVLGLALAPTVQGSPTQPNVFRKGALYAWEDIVYGAPMPSVNSLVKAHFTIVGVMFAPCFSTFCTKPITNWLRQAKAAGLKTYTMIGNSYANSVSWIPILVGLNIDYLDIDEPIGTYNWTITQLQSYMASVVALKHAITFVVNEFGGDIQQLYALRMPNLIVAEDDCWQTAMIDYNIQLGQQHGKPAIAWIEIIPTLSNYDCYVNFNAWLTHAKQQNANIMFFYVDQEGNWLKNWETIVAY